MAVIKISYAAWEVTDRRKFLAKSKRTSEVPNDILRRNPTILDFLSYTCGFVACGGPVTTLIDYIDFVDRKRNYRFLNPCPWSEAGAYLTFLFTAVVYGVLGAMAPKLDQLTDPSFSDYHFLKKYWMIALLGSFVKYKYHFAFNLSQLGLNSAGISYNHCTREFNRWRGMIFWSFEASMRSLNRVRVRFNLNFSLIRLKSKAKPILDKKFNSILDL